MRLATDTQTLRAALAPWRGAGRIGLVATMGNLHRGHVALVDRMRSCADRVVATIFVNPMQFDRGEDLARYPRTFDADWARLAERGVDVVFAPTPEVMYPRGSHVHTQVLVPGLTDTLEGAHRPGHFVGVATVVAKLLMLVQPQVAVFGEKDLQQLVLIRRMVADLQIPTEILGEPTVREPDGLALSSRNQYLGESERARAPVLYRTLCAAATRLLDGAMGINAVEREAVDALTAGGLTPDYVCVRALPELGAPWDAPVADLVVLGAAWLGQARLIDNVAVAEVAR